MGSGLEHLRTGSFLDLEDLPLILSQKTKPAPVAVTAVLSFVCHAMAKVQGEVYLFQKSLHVKLVQRLGTCKRSSKSSRGPRLAKRASRASAKRRTALACGRALRGSSSKEAGGEARRRCHGQLQGEKGGGAFVSRSACCCSMVESRVIERQFIGSRPQVSKLRRAGQCATTFYTLALLQKHKINHASKSPCHWGTAEKLP